MEEEKAELQRELEGLRSGKKEDAPSPLSKELADAKATIKVLKSKLARDLNALKAELEKRKKKAPSWLTKLLNEIRGD